MDRPEREMKRRFQTMLRFACKWTVLKTTPLHERSMVRSYACKSVQVVKRD
jgi:hypothetical protein